MGNLVVYEGFSPEQRRDKYWKVVSSSATEWLATPLFDDDDKTSFSIVNVFENKDGRLTKSVHTLSGINTQTSTTIAKLKPGQLVYFIASNSYKMFPIF